MALPLGRICLRSQRPLPSIISIRTTTELLLSRSFHHSLRATAKKKKTKAVVADDPFDEDNESDDLFGSHNVRRRETKTSFSTEAIDLDSKTRLVFGQEQERLREKEKQRVQEFDKLLELLQRATGENGRNLPQKPGNSSLIRLIGLAKTREDIQCLMVILKQWGTYTTSPLSKVVDPVIIETAVKTGNVDLLLLVLSHRPLYRISVPTPKHARLLLKTIVSPANSFPPSYSPSLKNVSKASTDHSIYKHRLEDALRLADILSKTFARVPLHQPSIPTVGMIVDGAHGSTASQDMVTVPLSPSTDLVSGSILLSSLIRVISSGEGGEAVTDYVEAAVQLVQKQKRAATRGKIINGAQSRELLWALSSLNECKAAVTKEEFANVLKPRLFIEWIDAAMALIIKQLSGRGKTVAGRIENLQGSQSLDGAFERVFGSSITATFS